MALSAKFVKKQLKKIKPLTEGATIEVARQQHDMIGNLMVIPRRWKVSSRTYRFANFSASMVYPLDETREGIILYLHGGGYACGGLDYARAFGTVLATESSVRVFARHTDSLRKTHTLQLWMMHLSHISIYSTEATTPRRLFCAARAQEEDWRIASA